MLQCERGVDGGAASMAYGILQEVRHDSSSRLFIGGQHYGIFHGWGVELDGA